MFERFTENARQTIVLAQDEARAAHHDAIDVAHLLAALTLQPGTVAQKALGEVGYSTSVARERVKMIPVSPSLSPQVPFAPSLKRALAMALREALSLGHNYIGPEHVLLGAIGVERKEEFATGALEAGALDLIHDEVMRLLGSSRRAAQERKSREDAPGALGAEPDSMGEACALQEALRYRRALIQIERSRPEGLPHLDTDHPENIWRIASDALDAGEEAVGG